MNNFLFSFFGISALEVPMALRMTLVTVTTSTWQYMKIYYYFFKVIAVFISPLTKNKKKCVQNPNTVLHTTETEIFVVVVVR